MEEAVLGTRLYVCVEACLMRASSSLDSEVVGSVRQGACVDVVATETILDHLGQDHPRIHCKVVANPEEGDEACEGWASMHATFIKEGIVHKKAAHWGSPIKCRMTLTQGACAVLLHTNLDSGHTHRMPLAGLAVALVPRHPTEFTVTGMDNAKNELAAQACGSAHSHHMLLDSAAACAEWVGVIECAQLLAEPGCEAPVQVFFRKATVSEKRAAETKCSIQ